MSYLKFMVLFLCRRLPSAAALKIRGPQISAFPLVRRLACLACLFSAGVFQTVQADLPEPLAKALRQASVPESAVSLLIQRLDSVVSDVAHYAAQASNPASVMKLLTTLAALDTLGPAYTWRTRVLVDGQVVDGVLHGHLILQGGGDPSLTQERFGSLLREVRARGIREILGDVILDNSLYAIELPEPGDFDQAPLKPYNANPAPLLVNYNAVTLRLSPVDARLSARLEPPSLPVELTGALDAQGVCTDWQDQLDIQRNGDILRISGRYPLACGERSLWLNLMCPAATAATAFKSLWQELGGVHTGQMRLGQTPTTARLWLEHESIPLSLIVRDINKFSNNVMAKMLFLNLGTARYGAPATWEKGQAAMLAWLTDRGLNFPEVVVENGSGLSRLERISPASMATLLTWAARQPLYYDFAASLPALGQDGTQKRRLNGTPLAGRAWLKSGSLNGIRNLAGYFMDAEGRRKVLVLFINHANPAQALQAQQAILTWALSSQIGE
jgi:D-alanyl-D-alanine carboxypeptidase/D-alanyl-D-alanine-endopeptidase (penicillin-binding protein 4)